MNFRNAASLPLIALTVLGISSSSTEAGEDLSPKGPILDTGYVDDSFDFDFRFNGWLAQLNTTVSNSNIGYSTNVFIGLDDILGNLDWIVPVGADLRSGRVGFLPDLVAMKLSGASPTPRRLFNRADLSMKLLTANMPLYYRIVDGEDLQIDLLAGARFLWVDIETSLSGGILGRLRGTTPATNRVQAWNAIGGIRAQQKLNDKWFYSIYADIGTGESDLTWQAQGDIGYRLKENIRTSVGYRYLTFDMSRRATDVGLTSSGVMITTTIDF